MAPPSSGEDNIAGGRPRSDLQVDTTTTASDQIEQQQAPLASPAEATEVTEMSSMRELRAAGAFSTDQTEETTADNNSSSTYGTAPVSVNAPVGPQQLQYQYGGTPTSAALAPSAASVAVQQPQQWTVEENGVRVQVTSHQATDGTMTLTLPSGAVVTLQAAPQQPRSAQAAPAAPPAAQMQMPMQPPHMQAEEEQGRRPSEVSMGFLPLGTFRGNNYSSSAGPASACSGAPTAPAARQAMPAAASKDDASSHATSNADMRVPFVPSLTTTGSGGGMTTATMTTGAADDSVRYIDPLSSRIQVGDGDGSNHEEGKVAPASADQSSSSSSRNGDDEDEIPPALSNVDSADAAAGDGSPQKKTTTKSQHQPQQQHGGRHHRRTTSSTSRSLGSQTIDGEQVTVLRAHALPNSSVIISSREGSVVEEQHDVEVLHKTMSVSSGSNNTNSNGSKSLGSGKFSSSSDPDLAAGGAPPVDTEFARKSESVGDMPKEEAAKAPTPSTDEASSAAPQTKPSAAPPKTEEEYKPLWLKAREEGREEEAPQSDPSKVYFVMNKQSNRKTEYYVSSGKDIPGLPHKDSAETDKPPSQIAMEENLRRAQKEATEAAALQKQQLEELAYLREMQRRHAELEGQYIYHDDDMTEVSELTMGVHEMGIGPSIAHTDVNVSTPASGAEDDVPDVVQSASYAQSVDWNNLTEEQKKQISSDMASRNGGAVGLPDNEKFVETMVNMFTPELCHKAEPTKKIVRGLGALQPLHSTRSINMYQHTRSGRGRGGRGSYYRPAAAAASSAQLPSINDVEYPSSPKSNGPTSSGGSTGDTNSTSSQRKVAKPISPLKSLKSVRGLHGGIN